MEPDYIQTLPFYLEFFAQWGIKVSFLFAYYIVRLLSYLASHFPSVLCRRYILNIKEIFVRDVFQYFFF